MLKFALPLAVMAASAFAPDEALPSVCTSATGRVAVSGRTLLLSGSIDPDFADCFAKAYTSQITDIAVDLTGGMPDPALRIANLIADRRVPITVRYVCGSACASYILPAASLIVVDASSMILFHNTGTSSVAMNGGRKWPSLDRYRRQSQVELALYKKVGVDPTLLTLPQQLIGTVCVMQLKDASGRLGDLGFMARYQAVSLSQAALEEMGLKFSGHFAWSLADISAGIERGTIRQDPAVLQTLTFGWRLPDKGHDPKAGGSPGLHRLPTCTAAQLANDKGLPTKPAPRR